MAGMSGAIRAGAAFVELLIKADPLVRGLNQVSARLEQFGKSIAATGAKIAAAGGIISAPFISAAKEFAETGSELDKLSRLTGISASALSELTFAAGGVDAVSLAFRGLSQKLANAERGSKATAAAFASVGLSVKDLQSLNPEDRFTTAAKAVAGIADPMQRAAAAMNLFGRGGRELLPVLSRGAGHIDMMRGKSRELGISLSGEQVAAAVAMSKAYKALSGSIKGIWMSIGSAVAPVLTELVGLVTKAISVAAKWIKENKESAVTVFKWALGVTVLGSAIVSLGGAFAVASVAAGGLAAAVGLVGTVLGGLLSPVAIATAAVAGLGYLLVTRTEAGQRGLAVLSERFASLSATAVTTWGGIRDAMMSGDLGLAAQIAFQGVKVAALDATQEIRAAWDQISGYVMGAWDAVSAYLQQKLDWLAGLFGRLGVTIEGLLGQALKGLMPVVALADAAGIGRGGTGKPDKALDEARAKLDQLAREARAKAGPGGKVAEIIATPAARAIPTAEEIKTKATETMGGFSAAAFGRLGYGTSIEKESLDEQKKTNELLEEMNEKLEPARWE